MRVTFFFSKSVLLFLWSAWLYYHLWCDLYLLSMANYNFHLVSLNVQGIRDFQERKTNFTWIKTQKALLQETVPLKVKLHVSFSGEAKCFFAHGPNHGRGVLILLRD